MIEEKIFLRTDRKRYKRVVINGRSIYLCDNKNWKELLRTLYQLKQAIRDKKKEGAYEFANKIIEILS